MMDMPLSFGTDPDAPRRIAEQIASQAALAD
jgi:hypothetical protein